MTVYVLPGNCQLGERGMAINFPATPEEFLSKMSNVPLLAVMFENKNGTEPNVKHYIRPLAIYEALAWLKENNPLYLHTQLPDRSAFNDTVDDCTTDGIYIEETMAVSHNFYDCGMATEKLENESMPVLKIPLCKEKPINAYDILHGEEKAFPWLFC